MKRLVLGFITLIYFAHPALADVAVCAEFYSPSKSTIVRVENKLARGRIISDIPAGDGIYGARFVTYEDGTQGVWKSSTFMATDGTYNNSHAEIAAYKIDRFLGLKKVPPTVPKDYKGKSGTVQLRIQNIKELPSDRQYVPHPPELGFFDFLIANSDRNSGNILERMDGSIVAIDHRKSFNSTGSKALTIFEINFKRLVLALEKQKQIELLLVSETDPEKVEALTKDLEKAQQDRNSMLPLVQAFFPTKKVIEKLRSTTFEDWKELVGEHLSEDQIHQIVERQFVLLEKLENVERVLGSSLIYPKNPVRRFLPTQRKVNFFFM